MPTLPAQLDNDAYAKYADFDQISYRLVSHLLNQSEIVWKLLRYQDADAWNRPDLSVSEKRALIYNGEDDSTKFHVFLDTGLSDVFTREDCIVRLSPFSIYQELRSVGTVYIMLEVYSHFKVNHLSNFRTRVDMITTEFLRIFNGSEIFGLGKLNLDRLANLNAKSDPTGQIPFKGRSIILGNKAA